MFYWYQWLWNSKIHYISYKVLSYILSTQNIKLTMFHNVKNNVNNLSVR